MFLFRSLWCQSARRLHGERLRWPSSGGTCRARMSPSIVPATVPCSKRKLQPTRAVLTLTASAVNKIKLLKDKPGHVGVKVSVPTRGCNGFLVLEDIRRQKEILMKLFVFPNHFINSR